MPSGVQQAMNSHLQSNGATQAAKVDNLMPSAIFHSFLSPIMPFNPCLHNHKRTRTNFMETKFPHIFKSGRSFGGYFRPPRSLLLMLAEERVTNVDEGALHGLWG